MIEKLMVGILNTSVTGGISIIVFCILSWRFLQRNRAANRKNAWIFIAVYLLIPLHLDATPHIYTIQIPNIAAREHETVLYSSDGESELKSDGITKDEKTQDRANKANVRVNLSPEKILFVIWSAGIVFLFCYYLATYLKACSRVKRWSHDCQDESIMKMAAYIAAEVGLNRVPKIKVLEYSADGPFTMGILKCIILLPEYDFAEKDLYYILKHELIHCKEKDILWKLLFLAANMVHWFNPLVWLMRKFAENAIEQTCDDGVLKGASSGEYQEYCDIIMMWVKSRKHVLSTGYVAGASLLKQRFTNIYENSHKRNSSIPVVISVFMLFAINASVGLQMGEGIHITQSLPVAGGIEVRTDLDGDGEVERVYVSDNRIGEHAFTQVSAQFRNGDVIFKDYEDYWSSYIVTGDLSGNGKADVVVMKVSTGSTYGGGEVSILHMENGKWEEYPCRFLPNPSIEQEQPDNFEPDNFDFSAMGAAIISNGNTTLLRIIASHDMTMDTVKCIDCSYRDDGWYIEDLQIVDHYYADDKDIQLLGDFFQPPAGFK